MSGRPRSWKGIPAIQLASALAALLAACGDTVPDASVLCFIEDNADGTQLVTCDNGTDFVVADGRVGRAGTGCRTEDNSDDGTVDMVCDNGLRFTVFDGRDGSSCRVEENVRGEVVIRCDDGSQGTVSDGVSCTTTADEEAGSVTISCEDGTTATVFNGEDAEPCDVSTDPELGTVIVTCGEGEGTLVDGVDGDTCRVVEDAETLDVSIICGEGEDATEEVVIPGSTRVATVTGVATLLGQDVHGRILVEVVGREGELITSTAPDGSYSLARVPVGVRAFRFSFGGYSSVVVDNVPVVPGQIILDPVELRPSEVIAEGTRNVILDVCNKGETVVLLMNARAMPTAFSFDGEQNYEGRLAVWNAGDLAPTVLSENATSFPWNDAGFCPGGNSVAFLQDFVFEEDRATGTIWSRSGTTRSFPIDEDAFIITEVLSAEEADKYLVFTTALVDDDVILTVEVYDAPTDTLLPVVELDADTADFDFEFSDDGRVLLYEIEIEEPESEELYIFRTSDGANFLLATDDDLIGSMELSDDSRYLAYVEVGALDRLRIFDVAAGDVIDVATGEPGSFFSDLLFSDDGNWLVYGYDYDGSRYQLALYDVVGDESVDLLGGRAAWLYAEFDPTSSRLAYFTDFFSSDSATSATLRMRDLAADTTPLSRGPTPASTVAWSPDGLWLSWYLGPLGTELYSVVDDDYVTLPFVFSLDWSPASNAFVAVTEATDTAYRTSDFELGFEPDERIDLVLDGFGVDFWGFSEDGARLGVDVFFGAGVIDVASGDVVFATDEELMLQPVASTFLFFEIRDSRVLDVVADMYGLFPGSGDLMLLDTSLVPQFKGTFVVDDGRTVVYQTAHTSYPEYLSDALRFMSLP